MTKQSVADFFQPKEANVIKHVKTGLIHKSKGKQAKTMNSVTGAKCSAAPEGGSFKADGQNTKLLRTVFASAHSAVKNSLFCL